MKVSSEVRAFLSKIGTKGGAATKGVKTEAKAKAARENGVREVGQSMKHPALWHSLNVVAEPACYGIDCHTHRSILAGPLRSYFECPITAVSSTGRRNTI